MSLRNSLDKLSMAYWECASMVAMLSEAARALRPDHPEQPQLRQLLTVANDIAHEIQVARTKLASGPE
jgi:hypothetical protein